MSDVHMERRSNRVWRAGVFAAWLWLAAAGVAAPPAAVTPERIAAEQAYDSAKARYQTNGSDDEAAWQFGRACSDRADCARKDTERAAVAKEGIAACEKLLRRNPKLAAGHYYLGMNQAQLARTKSLGALPLVREMEKEWKRARELDEHIDFAGPDRNLGSLYRDAPRAPLSIGHRASAEEHMRRAVELAPEYPENHLNLIETYIKWDQMPAAAGEDYKLREILPAARKQLSGPQWQSAWEDWDRRQEAILSKIRSTVWRWSPAPGGKP